jgi:hypothetical protein
MKFNRTYKEICGTERVVFADDDDDDKGVGEIH